MRHDLHRGGARADDPHRLVTEPIEPAFGAAAGIIIVPAAGVEGVARERLDAGNAGQFRAMQRAVRHHHEARADRIAAIGRDGPAAVIVVPSQIGDLGLEKHVAVEIILLGDAVRVIADLGALRIFALGDEAGFLEQRQIDVAFDIAGGAGIAVPIPGAAERAALLDQPDVLDARLAQPRAGEQPAEAAADHHDFLLVGERRAIDRRFDIRIGEEVREPARHLDILFVGVAAQALVAFLAVFRAQRLWIEGQRIGMGLVDGLRLEGHRIVLTGESSASLPGSGAACDAASASRARRCS